MPINKYYGNISEVYSNVIEEILAVNQPLLIGANGILDLTGLSCPHPLLGAKKVLDGLKPGEVLCLVSDCAGTKDDLFSWIKQTDNEVIRTDKDADGADEYFIRKGRRPPSAFHVALDMSGMACPGPIVEARKFLQGMQSGEILKLISSCPATRDDIDAWIKSSGNALLEIQEIDPGVLAFYIQKN
ncbi:MAG: sulfurtransferase TusA family protein [Sulfurimicrobium sp.]|nr:sulfurtransferase TusA family protein [Sulfurimicrobium sp.]MDP1705651.1 sulfurtransferase TusA family protein [Sulfurimicrobium sp.]MDP1897501.1 sulfurtransferase TusA family protein [Sulfurimicrobium sp.]MDP3686815.1 sulfurtransferase TusA family protein [Sulfurimicrobium sp.]MDZ7654765.1 sulfurtransferase TusA family protein [Sulfurimicrobium sp.]